MVKTVRILTVEKALCTHSLFPPDNATLDWEALSLGLVPPIHSTMLGCTKKQPRWEEELFSFPHVPTMVLSSWSFCFSPLRKTSEKNLWGTFSACRVKTPLERSSPRPDRTGQDIGHVQSISRSASSLIPLYASPPGSHPGAPSPGQTLSIRSEGLVLFLFQSPKNARVGFWVSTSTLQTQTLPQRGCLEAMLGKGWKKIGY